MDPLQQILDILGAKLHLALHVDQRSACSILLESNLLIQLQLTEIQDRLLLFAKLGEIPPGKFRENLLGAALKANGESDPIAGILSYIARENCLALYQSYPLDILREETLLALFGGFSAMALQWQEALRQGTFPQSSGFFG